MLGVIHATAQAAATSTPWLAGALSDLAASDPAAAERVLLSGLVIQGDRVEHDVTYELTLPATGRHRVEVTRGGPVTVTPLGSAEPVRAEFRLSGGAGALAVLVAGGAPRRLEGVKVRGRRRRLRRLLRVLDNVFGLPELVAAGGAPAPEDLLALLCAHVPAARVGRARLRVAYLVADHATRPARVVVQAGGGTLAVALARRAVEAVDATVTVEPQQLIGVLLGTQPALVEGDQAAVARLHGWVRTAQGLPA